MQQDIDDEVDGDIVREDTLENEIDLEEAEDVSDDLVPLPHGDALNPDEASKILSARQANVLVVAGAVGSGKTTLIASLFHCFQRGPFAGYLFAGSESLIGFDMRCHLARTCSGAKKMDTERTLRGIDRTLLHLKLRPDNLNAKMNDILLADLSGEEFQRAKNSIEDCQELDIIGRADNFILLIDGEDLVNLEKRQGVKKDALMLLRMCFDSEQLNEHSLVDILFTKWDLVEGHEDKSGSEKFIGLVKKSIEDAFSDKFARLAFYEVAARHNNDPSKLGYGLDKVFSTWVETVTKKASSRDKFLRDSTVNSEFDNYLERQLPSLFN